MIPARCQPAWRSTPSRCAARPAASRPRAVHALADRGGERPPVRPADRRACQPARRRRRRGAAHHSECLSPETTSPSSASIACASSCAAPATRRCRCTSCSCAHADLDRLRRRRGRSAPVVVPPAASSPSASRPRRRCCPGRRAAFPAFDCSPNISPSRRSSCSSTSPDRREDHAVRRQPAGDLRLSGPRRAGAGTHDRCSTLALGCTPLVNLFPQRCEPIRLIHTDTEYRVVPDARRPRAVEVWSVERVRDTLPDGSFRPWRPFYRLTATHATAGKPRGGDPAASTTSRAVPPRRAFPAPKSFSRRMIPTSTRTSPPTPCCPSTRCASTATCPPTCRSAAAIRHCDWWKAPRPWSRHRAP